MEEAARAAEPATARERDALLTFPEFFAREFVSVAKALYLVVVRLPGGGKTLSAPVGSYTSFYYCGPRDPGLGSTVSVSPFEPDPGSTSAH